ncbi:hypothetical protein [Sporolactobacillus terrae]|uniref:hypothetical protein n=1 Tax=Sporolactobacillus terrae TaxID=269673 RepID=UPI000685E766|nr:hypothetical protein [Sporolactobacillus terrae]
MGQLGLFSIHSGPQYDKTFATGDQVSLVLISFTCHDFEGELSESNEESMNNQFFALDDIPNHLFVDHQM